MSLLIFAACVIAGGLISRPILRRIRARRVAHWQRVNATSRAYWVRP